MHAIRPIVLLGVLAAVIVGSAHGQRPGGSRFVTLKNLIGLRPDVAISVLDRSGVKVKVLQVHATRRIRTVSGQVPAAGSRVPLGAVVTLVVTAGP